MSMRKFPSRLEEALSIVRNKAPRITERELRFDLGALTSKGGVSKKHNAAGKGHNEIQNAAKPPLGWIFGDYYRPWQRRFSSQHSFNADIAERYEYPPMSLLELQRLIDLGWIDTAKPIDLASLCNIHRFSCDPEQRQFGVQLTDEGCDIFDARVNIEVQHASELAIAAIERQGGRITCAYFDSLSLTALTDPARWFVSGRPIPRRSVPPSNIIGRYLDPKLRGYLCDKRAIADARVELAQKYGYALKDVDVEDVELNRTKDPLQVFYGLHPGWIVDLRNRTILKSTNAEVADFYSGEEDLQHDDEDIAIGSSRS